MCESNGDGQKHHCSFQTDYNPIATNTIMKKKNKAILFGTMRTNTCAHFAHFVNV